MKKTYTGKSEWITATGLDIFSEEPVLEFSHADLIETDECCGTFHRRVISVGKDKQEVFWCCDECLELMTREELITLAAETYGHEWERFCVVEKDEPEDESWDILRYESCGCDKDLLNYSN